MSSSKIDYNLPTGSDSAEERNQKSTEDGASPVSADKANQKSRDAAATPASPYEANQKSMQNNAASSGDDVSRYPSVISVGSRRSELALRQTHEVLSCLGSSGCQFRIVHMDTIGDQILDKALSMIGDKGLFTQELDAALISGQVQFVVHSLKDLPTQCPEGLVVPCILRRELPCDALVLHPRHTDAGIRGLAELPAGCVLGTSSLRRAAQLGRAHPSLRFESVRGNLGTRWRKLLAEGSGLDGLILAEAGLTRLGWEARIACRLESGDCLPAVGQGALAVQCRAGDAQTIGLLKPLVHRDTFLEVTAERSLLRALDGGCSVPLGVHTSWESARDKANSRTLHLEARVLSTDGAEVVDFSAGVELRDPTTDETGDAGDEVEPPNAKRRRKQSGGSSSCGPQPEAAVGLLFPEPDSRDLQHLAECVRLGRLVADGLLARGAGPVLAAAKAAAKAAIGKPLPQQPAHASV